MKSILIISLLSMLGACGPSRNYEPPPPQQVCAGKLEKVTDRHLRMTCDSGRVINYTSYKYGMTEQ